MYRVKIPSTPKVAGQSAGPAPEQLPVATLFFKDSKAIFNHYHPNVNFLKNCIEDMAAKIKTEDDIGSMYLLGLMHVEGKIAGHQLAALQDLPYGITLLERVIYKYDPESEDPLVVAFKPLAQASAFKLYELHSGKLADKSKINDERAATYLEIAALLGDAKAAVILNAKPAQQCTL